MSSRVQLRRTPAGILSLVLPCAAIAASGVVALAQRNTATGDAPEPNADTEVATSVDITPVAPPLYFRQSVGHAILPADLRKLQRTHAESVAAALEKRATVAPNGATPVSSGDLHLLHSALAISPDTQ